MATKTAIVTIAGRPNVGKSTLTNYLVGEKIAIVSNKPQTTRNRICGVVTRGATQFVFVDTPGYHRARTKLGDYMVNTVRESIADVDATILVVEPIASIGPQEEGLIEKIKASRSPAILAINKIDTVEKDTLLEVIAVSVSDSESYWLLVVLEVIPRLKYIVTCTTLHVTVLSIVPLELETSYEVVDTIVICKLVSCNYSLNITEVTICKRIRTE